MKRLFEAVAIALASVLAAIVFSRYDSDDDKHWRDME